MTISPENLAKLNFYSGADMDKIVDTLTGSFTIGAGGPGGSQSFATDTQYTGFGSYIFTEGLFSIDGGQSWIDLGNSYPNGTDSVAGQLYLSVEVVSYTDSSIAVLAQNFTRSAYTIEYKVNLIARPDQGIIQNYRANLPFNFLSDFNYMIIYKEDIVTLSANTNTTIKHGLSYVPNFIIWKTTDQNNPGDNLGLALAGWQNATIDTGSLTISNVESSTRAFYYRIYYDG